MTKAIVVANWKMNPPTMREARKLFEATKKAAEKAPNVSLIIAPPSIYLRDLSSSYRGRQISFAAQSAHFEARGAFTGEISMEQARGAGASYILVGHSERRAAGETNEDTQKKISAALAHKLHPILCVGEPQRDSGGGHFAFVREELAAGLRGIAASNIARTIIAYEPVWAIGGESAIAPRDMHEMAIFVRKTIVDLFGPVGHSVKILYGGSIDEKSALRMMEEGDVRGLLVGHVSISAKRFAALLQSLAPVHMK